MQVKIKGIRDSQVIKLAFKQKMHGFVTNFDILPKVSFKIRLNLKVTAGGYK